MARAVISSVPTTAGPMPPMLAGTTFGGMSAVRNCQLMIEAPLAITVYRTNPSGMITSTNAMTMSTVAMRFLAAPPGRRLPQVDVLPGRGSHHAPLCRRPERSTIARAMMLMMIVKANRRTPIPMSAARNTPVASPNSFAMTEGML